MLLGILLIVALSAVSLAFVGWILAQPSRAVEQPVISMPLPAFDLDDGYFDTRGLA